MATHLLEELREHAEELGCENEMEGVRSLIEGGTGAHRQLEVLERSGDVKELIRATCEATRV
jgi:carboxylate-amine ligase